MSQQTWNLIQKHLVLEFRYSITMMQHTCKFIQKAHRVGIPACYYIVHDMYYVIACTTCTLKSYKKHLVLGFQRLLHSTWTLLLYKKAYSVECRHSITAHKVKPSLLLFHLGKMAEQAFVNKLKGPLKDVIVFNQYAHLPN